MWTREELKKRAKGVLKKSYWKAFLVSLILVIISSGGTGSGVRWELQDGFSGIKFKFILDRWSFYLPFVGIVLTILILLFVFSIFFKVFVGNALAVGGRRFFVKATEEDVNLEHLGFSFQQNRYLDIIKTMFYRDILIILWTLLLIIPGIIKTIAYSMVPYILEDNPNIGYKRALELSNEMTHGEKWDIFVLDLSFLGWYILGFLLFFIGGAFVQPYVDATQAQLYLVLRQKAIDNEFTSYEELRMS